VRIGISSARSDAEPAAKLFGIVLTAIEHWQPANRYRHDVRDPTLTDDSLVDLLEELGLSHVPRTMPSGGIGETASAHMA
jgi:hypothetical protein